MKLDQLLALLKIATQNNDIDAIAGITLLIECYKFLTNEDVQWVLNNIKLLKLLKNNATLTIKKTGAPKIAKATLVGLSKVGYNTNFKVSRKAPKGNSGHAKLKRRDPTLRETYVLNISTYISILRSLKDDILGVSLFTEDEIKERARIYCKKYNTIYNTNFDLYFSKRRLAFITLEDILP